LIFFITNIYSITTSLSPFRGLGPFKYTSK